MYDWDIRAPAYLCPCRELEERGPVCTVNWEPCSKANCEKFGKKIEPKKYKGEKAL